jgi:hypothetical protein
MAKGNPLIKNQLGGEEPVWAKWRHSELFVRRRRVFNGTAEKAKTF